MPKTETIVLSVPGIRPFIFNQSVPASTWVVAHKLGHNPAVTITDSTGRVTIGDIIHNSVNQCTITFSGAFSGIATCV